MLHVLSSFILKVMPNKEVELSISSNNSELESFLLEDSHLPEIKFVKENKQCGYRIFLIDLSQDLSNISQSLINQYGICREKEAKFLAIILHGEAIDTEKNHYFQKMLDDLGKDSPLHRLIFTKDLYQKTSSSPITPLDKYIYESINTSNINISEKGENLVFPLSISDFVRAITKTLFLTNTAGQSFWILGDPIKDLEFAYLIKKNINNPEGGESDINTSKKNDPKTNSLLGIGNKTRGELNWNPENEIYEDLKQIIGQYSNGENKIEIKPAKLNIIHRLILWAYKPRKKREKSLPSIKKIAIKLIALLLIVISATGIVCVASTGMALKQLEVSLNQTLNGNIEKSVNSLQSSIKLKRIGEYAFSTITPLANIISPKDTVKIANTYSFIDYSSTSLGNLHQTYVLAERLLLSLNPSEPTINYSDLSLALHSNLSQIYENLNQIIILSNNKLPSFLDKKIKENKEFQNLKLLEDQIVQFIKISDVIPAVFSNEKPKNILVLLQNSQISKPSGGELDYFLLLTLNEGKLLSKKYFTPEEINTLYEASVSSSIKTKRNVPPPPTVQDLAENPNFPISANDVSLRIEKTINTKPDFVIATNDHLIKQLLSEEKSASIDQFSEEFIASSGATIYKETVDGFLDRLFKNNIPLPVIGRTLAKMIGENHILLWSSSQEIQKIISTQSYSGIVIPHQCNVSIGSGNSCIAETSYISETMDNISRKSPWDNRQITHKIDISSNISHEYQIDYQPTELKATPSAILTKFDLYQTTPSTIDQILLNDLPTSMKDIVKTQEGRLDRYQITLGLKPNQNNSIIFKTTTFSVDLSTQINAYSLTEYRQPGIVDNGISLIINYPKNLRPSIVTSSFEAQPEQMRLTLPLHISTFGFTLEQNTQ